MNNPVIVEAVRTPIGKRNGVLSRPHSSFLLGVVQKAVLARADVRPKDIGQVIGGCVTQVGEQAFNITRMAWLTAGLPYQIAATTVDCQCGSSQQANHLVHNMISAGAIDIGVACGVEMMSRVPIGANTQRGPGKVKSEDFPYDMPDQFLSAERIATKNGFTREQADSIGLLSQQRAARALAEGRFKREIVPVEVPGACDDRSTPTVMVDTDEGPRETTAEGLAGLKPILANGIHTAGNTSQISDGASAVLWMEDGKAKAMGLVPLPSLFRPPSIALRKHRQKFAKYCQPYGFH
jgi:acetyl-CoA C-acetyltransferase